ncbi:BRCA2-interacting transcriptional repressor EMSY [Echinococcus granulosus]|nr:BRCA2-interacting transcriptional repressor EMSY [Echinococcus granulosus]
MVENIAYNKHNGIRWPMLVDYSKTDCRRILRRHEVEAYAKVVTAFRAQGLLTGEKRKLLEDLRRLLSIACDRHKAEVRRAVNDEELATISKFVCGQDTDENWVIEGRRIAPILQRGVPQTAFLPEADAVAKKWAFLNYQLPQPAETAVVHTDSTNDRERNDANHQNVKSPSRIEADLKENDNNEAKVSVTLLENTIVQDGDTVSTMVPEAAVEITCEAEVPKSDPISCVVEEKTSLITELPMRRTIHYGQSNSKRISSVSIPSNADDIPHNVPTVQSKPISHTCISGIKRSPSVTESLQVTNLVSELVTKTPKPATTSDSTTNGVVPFISTRNFVIRQNNISTSSSGPLHSSQSVQINKIQSINPAISVSGHNRITSTAVTSTTPGLTTVVVTGTTGPTAYVSQSVNASRIVKNYPPVIGYQPSVPSTTQLSASSILADTKKHQQLQQQHSIVVQQQQPQVAGSTAGNVIVVHRGHTNRLVTASSAVPSTPHVSLTTNLSSNSSTSLPIVSTSSRSVRILPVNTPLVTPATPVTTTTGNTTYTPLLSGTQLQNYTHQHLHQPNYRLSSSTTIICNDPELPTGATNIVKMPIGGGLLSRSTVSSNPTLASNPPAPSQVNSPALVSVLEPKRPRLAFVPAAASPSARQ